VIRHAFNHAGHFTKTVEWGNTRNFAQCDAEHPNRVQCQSGSVNCQGWAGSNGNGAIIHIGHNAEDDCYPGTPSCRFYYWNYGYPSP
jgi:hypothetical protein